LRGRFAAAQRRQLSKLKRLVTRREAPANKTLESTPQLTLRKQACYNSIAPRLSWRRSQNKKGSPFPESLLY